MPTPNTGENRSNFMIRCMSSAEAQADFPDNNQRVAFCISQFNKRSQKTMSEFVKVDEELGLVFGFAIICQKNGEDYYDLHNDHIPEDSMLKAATDFMLHSRMAGDMHERDSDDQAVAKGTVVFAFPLTSDVAKSLDIETETTGLLIAMKPSDPEILDKFKSGKYTGFSIGGSYGECEDSFDD